PGALVDLLLLGSQQVEEHRVQPVLAQRTGDLAIARARAAAPTAVGEHNDPDRGVGHADIANERAAIGQREVHGALARLARSSAHHSSPLPTDSSGTPAPS